MRAKNFLAGLLIAIFLGIGIIAITFFVMSASLPKLITLADYKPLVVSQVFSKDGKKVGEFAREKRIVIPYSKMPKMLVNAFVAAEDSEFFRHKGINYLAILRAAMANLKAGHTVQGGSTITQQTAKSLMLTSKRELSRKIKEAILAVRMEKNLSKEDILYLYLNQIYLGHGAYGVEAAAENYFRKSVSDLTLAECAILAGLPQAPGKFAPHLRPQKSKERQIYVLNRMVEEGFVTKEEAVKAAVEEVKVYYRESFTEIAPFYLETVRQFLVQELGEEKVLDEGIKVYLAMDYKKQVAAQESVNKNLRDLDKRQGYRGVKKNLKEPQEIAGFLAQTKEDLITKSLPYRVLYPIGREPAKTPLDLNKKFQGGNLPDYLKLEQITEGVVTKVDSEKGLVTVRVAEAIGLIDIDDMKWARLPDSSKHWTEVQIADPAKALSVGDIIEVKIKSEKFSSERLNKLEEEKQKNSKKKLPQQNQDYTFANYLGLSLEQEPIVEGALLSFDLETGDVLSIVGGSNFERSEYNRAIQAARQTGSAFKVITYAAAIDKGFQANTVILDAPVVFEEGEGQESKKWKPGNFENKFSGDTLFRTALIKSLNIPTVKIIEKIGVDWVAKYARRLGIFSPLNLDFTLALGSSSVTLYEMTKAMAVFPRAGKRLRPLLIKKVTDFTDAQVLIENIYLDKKFEKDLNRLEVEFHPELAAKLGLKPDGSPLEPELAATPMPQTSQTTATSEATPTESAQQAQTASTIDPAFAFEDPEQVISPQSAYLTLHLLKGVVNEGTGYRAKALGRPSAGKTGTTNGYYDAWYVGFTPQIATGVWVGFDAEKPIGRLETGASAALPIWVDYMKVAHEEVPATDFAIPSGIVFANIDIQTGKLATVSSKKSAREAFRDGNEPTTSQDTPTSDEKSFLKEDLSD
ncbi:MAG: PBP1A family penicillin-binding protein [Oligoflexia bacterium]|nr:PBP1A family penicillin-binding protein [Oligoflexia bacterium]